MRMLIVLLSLLIMFSVPVLAASNFSIGFELYPNKMEGLAGGDWLQNGEEWFATTVGFDVSITERLNTSWQIKTYLFATNGFRFAPSSVKYINSISYDLSEKVQVKYQHFCHHYFEQYQGDYSDQDKMILEYLF